jgi:hypothetical protein
MAKIKDTASTASQTARSNAASASRYAGQAQSLKLTAAQKASVPSPTRNDDYSVTSADGSVQGPGGSYTPAPYKGVSGGNNAGALNALTGGQSDDQWLSGDATYQAQLAALQQALADSQSDFTNQKTKYDTDYNDSLKNLGWVQPMVDDPSTPDINEAAAGKWNLDDLNTSSGRAYQNQENDFAGRGLLQSTLYANANDNLMRSLNDQLGGVNTGRQNFLSDLATQQTTAQNQNNASQQQARADALARMAASLAL